MSQDFAPEPKPVTVDGTATTLVAFYFPGSNTPWDDVYKAPFLGNFWSVQMQMTVAGATAPFHVAEAAFQALKWWSDPALRQLFSACQTGDAAFSQKRKLEKSGPPPDPGYAGLGRDGGMDAVLAAKFADAALAAGLLATGSAYLLEHNSATGRDHYWSDDADGSGGNHLGLALMRLRHSLGGAPDPMPGTAVVKFTALV